MTPKLASSPAAVQPHAPGLVLRNLVTKQQYFQATLLFALQISVYLNVEELTADAFWTVGIVTFGWD